MEHFFSKEKHLLRRRLGKANLGRDLEDSFNLQIVMNVTDALKQTKLFEPDSILLDIMMPGLSGYDVCKKLSSDAMFTHSLCPKCIK